MPRKESEAIPEDNGSVSQQEEFGSGQPTLVDVYQVPKIEELCDRKMDEITKLLEHHLASLEQDALQPRLAMEADGPADTKTRKRTEGAATIVQAMHGDSCSANRVDPEPMCSTSFGNNSTGPPEPPCSRLMPWKTAALRRPNRVSYPWRCAQDQPPVAYFPPAKPLR